MSTPGHKGSVTLRVLSVLLRYPDAAIRSHLREMGDLIQADGALSKSRQAQIQALLRQLAASEPLEAEMAYVELFDRGRATSLYLFEHVHGESRDRGPAMISLGETYAKAGLLLHPDELPDYLPVVLEFVATQPPREAGQFLGEIAHLLNAIFAALLQRRSLYAAVPGALLDMAGHKAEPVELPAEPALDDNWLEPAAFDGCSTAGQGRPGQAQPVRIVRKSASPHPGGSQ